MHPAQVYRRSIVLPLDSLAVVRLEAGDVEPDTRVEVLPVGERFSSWFFLFNDINRVCGTNIDDHAIEQVPPETLDRVEEYLRSLPKKGDEGLVDFRRRLAELCERAIAARMPLFFIF